MQKKLLAQIQNIIFNTNTNNTIQQKNRKYCLAQMQVMTSNSKTIINIYLKYK